MLGHLCALYDRGIFEAARLMSNLLFQLSIERRGTNIPLLAQVGLSDLPIVIDDHAKELGSDDQSPLAGIRFGVGSWNPGEAMKPFAQWIPLFAQHHDNPRFSAVGLADWLTKPIIPTGNEVLNRQDLITFVRDQDGGAHSDTDERIAKSQRYLELVDWFPLHKASTFEFEESVSIPWEMLPPYTHVLLRQISHELLSAIFSNSHVGALGPPPTLIVLFDGTKFGGAFVPKGYPALDPIHGQVPIEIDSPARPRTETAQKSKGDPKM
jgi:hypothetical protein